MPSALRKAFYTEVQIYVTCAAVSATRNVNICVPAASVPVVGFVNVPFTALISVTVPFPVPIANVSVPDQDCTT